MSRIGGWLRRSTTAPVQGTLIPSMNPDVESKSLEDALQAVILIMNDDIEGAEKGLTNGTSTFHQLGRGLTQFMRSVLGVEQDVMKEAGERLSEVEDAALADMRRAQKDGISGSKVYPPGTEYSLCHAEAQLMSAVVAVLHESLTDSIKGFYKLRKAFITLDGIMEFEQKHRQERLGIVQGQKSAISTQNGDHMPGEFDDTEFTDLGSLTISEKPNVLDVTGSKVKGDSTPRSEDDDSDLEFVDADELHLEAQTTSNYQGHLNSDQDASQPPAPSPTAELTATGQEKVIPGDLENDDSEFNTPVDIFIHTGSNLCYGLLLLIISMVPPAFSRVLSIIGFKGDRPRGISMLWKSTKFDNINGAMAGLILLGYYNGIAGFCDILLTDTNSDDVIGQLTGYPKARCELLLTEMRRRYPGSRLWRLEEARVYSGNRDLKTALDILGKNTGSKMKQVAALNMFERSFIAMYIHNYVLSARCFQECLKLNNWSHAVYYYNSGACYVELYRNARVSDPAAAEKYKAKAMEFFQIAPSHAGKKRLMARQLPLDTFVVRKCQKWEERAKLWGVDFVDAIGLSPIEEMIYLWNGYKRMGPSELQTSLEMLEWQRTLQPEKHESNLDEVAGQALIRSTIYRNQGRYDDARKALEQNILNHEKSEFKGHLFDDWSCPAAHYEMAVIAWLEKDLKGIDQKAKVAECEEWLHKAANWDTYVLDSRIGLRIRTGLETLKRYKSQS